MLETVLNSLPKHPKVERVYLHVQTSNADALAFYQKFGFTVVETIKDYYKRITPPDCYVLAKDVLPTGSGVESDAAAAAVGAGAGAGTAALPATPAVATADGSIETRAAVTASS